MPRGSNILATNFEIILFVTFSISINSFNKSQKSNNK